MTKTEQEMVEKMSRKGYAHFIGKRAFSVLKARQANYPELVFSFSVSQRASNEWGLLPACYEVSVRAK